MNKIFDIENHVAFLHNIFLSSIFFPGKESEAEGSSSAENLKTEDSQDATSSSSKATTAQSALEKDAASEEKQKAMQASTVTAYSVTECRSLVKTLVCGVKTITWGIASCRFVTCCNRR